MVINVNVSVFKPMSREYFFLGVKSSRSMTNQFELYLLKSIPDDIYTHFLLERKVALLVIPCSNKKLQISVKGNLCFLNTLVSCLLNVLVII